MMTSVKINERMERMTINDKKRSSEDIYSNCFSYIAIRTERRERENRKLNNRHLTLGEEETERENKRELDDAFRKFFLVT